MAIERFEIDTEQWAVVPREPTDEMLRGLVGPRGYTSIPLVEAFSAMLAAAPRPVPTDLESAVRAILKGIDKDSPDDDAWWETSGGAEFGRQKLAELLALIGEQPRPVPTSERLPTEADADCDGLVWVWHSQNREWRIWPWDWVGKIGDFTHWQPTGLTRPAEPDGGAQ